MNKNFDDFKSYVYENNQTIHESIQKSVENLMDKREYDNMADKHEDYRRAWVEIGIMKMLEHYHNWLIS